ncbi:MAG: hypothetical protein ACJAXU_002110, partial [Paracoccaceae bacterium]
MMFRQIFMALIIVTGIFHPQTAVAKIITCDIGDHRLTGDYKGGGNVVEYVRSILGTKFRVNTKNIKQFDVKLSDGWTRAPDVRASRAGKFNLYKFKFSDTFTDILGVFEHPTFAL